jgi:hypothetical protein
VQNGNAYDEGLREFWNPIKKYWSDPTTENREAIRFLVDPKSARWQYENGVADHTLVDPTTWTLDHLPARGCDPLLATGCSPQEKMPKLQQP